MSTIRAGQVWTGRRRSGLHRVLWVSACGNHVRVIRVGGAAGRWCSARILRRDYLLAEDTPSVDCRGSATLAA